MATTDSVPPSAATRSSARTRRRRAQSGSAGVAETRTRALLSMLPEPGRDGAAGWGGARDVDRRVVERHLGLGAGVVPQGALDDERDLRVVTQLAERGHQAGLGQADGEEPAGHSAQVLQGQGDLLLSLAEAGWTTSGRGRR